jgi:transmembrane sensor
MMTEESLLMTRNDARLEAARWVIALEDEVLGPEDWTAFENWLDEHPANLAAYEIAQRTWDEALALKVPDCAKLEGQFLERSNRAAPRYWVELVACLRWSGSGTARVLCGTCAALALSVTLFAWMFWTGEATPHAIYVTAVGEQRTLTLEDGTDLVLNTATEINVNFDHRRRTLELIRGEVLLKVTPDSRRPFVIDAGGARVSVLGTELTVRLRDSEHVEVIVADGRVGLNCRAGDSYPDCVTQLGIGGDVILEHRGTGTWYVKRMSLDSAEIQRRFSWATGQLRFSGEPMSEVIAELNRYSDLKIEIGDPRLERMRFGGVVDVRHADQIVLALGRLNGMRRDPTVTDPKVIRLIRAEP